MPSPSRGVHDIVDRQVKAWDLQRRSQQRLVLETPHPGHGPWITLSRQLGSGGLELSRRLEAYLGWTTYDHEIVARIAAEAHVTEPVVQERDEHAAGLFDDYLGSLMVPHDPGQAGYLQQMTRVVGEMARAGRAIIIGRGANWFLNRQYGVRLRVVAPLEQRVTTLAARDGITPEAARHRLVTNDAERRAFVRQVYHREIDDPMGYDLVINTGSLDLDTAADAVIAILARKFAPQK